MLMEQIKFAVYVVFHPFNGYWEIKYENKGKVWTALSLLFLLFMVIVLKRQHTGFIMNFNNPNTLNSLNELLYIILPFFLFCIANWSLTTLMDGEGKFKEIIMAAGYALVPMVVVNVFTTAASRVLNWEESSFLHLLDSTAFLCFLALLFIGTMTVHQYTIGKTVFTIFLTLVVIGIIIFLGMLFFSLIQQMVAFVMTIYQEITLRQ